MNGGGQQPNVVTVSVRGRATMPESAARRLENVAHVTYAARSCALTQAEAVALFAEADVVALTPKVAPPVDERLLAALPRLRGLALYATGYDFLDVELLRRYGVVLTHLPDYSTVSVAEHALGLLLSLSRRIHLGHDRSRGLVPPTTSLRGCELAERTVGVIGLGRIGRRFGRLARGVGMRVVATDPRPQRDEPEVEFLPLSDLLRVADAVCVMCPASDRGTPLLGADELAEMRTGTVLVNVSRSSLVDTRAAADGVRSGRLRGYAVDDVVCDPEADADLLTEGRVIQTGHSAWWSDEVLERGGAMWGESIRRLALGHPADVVEPVTALAGELSADGGNARDGEVRRG